MRKIFPSLMAAALVLATGSFCFAEQIDNPTYKNWSKFKPGTSVTVAMESDVGGSKTIMETTTTLVEVNADKCVTESKMSMTVGGNKMDMPANKTDVMAKIDKPAAATAPASMPDVKTSTEDVDVAGKKVKCTVTEAKSSNNGMDTSSKTWTSDEVPGMMVKSETTMSAHT